MLKLAPTLSINIESELNTQKERIQKFDENLKEVFRSLEKYVDALKGT